MKPSKLLATTLMALGSMRCGRPAENAPQLAVDSPIVSAVDSSTRSAADSSMIASLDSCSALALGGAGEDSAQSSANSRTGPRWSGAVRSFDQFTLFVPDSARVGPGRGTSQLTLLWPRCVEHCGFVVAVYGDSGVSLEARVAQLVAEQRRIDSVNRNPSDGILEFDEIDGPPRPFTTPGGSGFVIDHSCGDCGATTFKFGREALIADVSIMADAMPGAGQRMCEMTVVARSFAWR